MDLPSLKLTWHLKMSHPKRKFMFQPSIFRGEAFVSGRVGKVFSAGICRIYLKLLGSWGTTQNTVCTATYTSWWFQPSWDYYQLTTVKQKTIEANMPKWIAMRFCLRTCRNGRVSHRNGDMTVGHKQVFIVACAFFSTSWLSRLQPMSKGLGTLQALWPNPTNY